MFLNENLVLIFFYVDIVAERMRADEHTTEPTTTTEERTIGTKFVYIALIMVAILQCLWDWFCRKTFYLPDAHKKLHGSPMSVLCD